MPRKIKYIAVITSVILLLGGFLAGRYVQADSAPEPGTALDPLVTQSYVDAQLKAQIQTLQNQVNALQARVAILEGKPSSGTTTPVVNKPPSDTTPNTGSITIPTGLKKVYPKNTGATINVRSGAGTNFSIVTKISATSPGIFLSEKNGWCYIKLSSGKYGWVRKDVVTIK